MNGPRNTHKGDSIQVDVSSLSNGNSIIIGNKPLVNPRVKVVPIKNLGMSSDHLRHVSEIRNPCIQIALKSWMQVSALSPSQSGL